MLRVGGQRGYSGQINVIYRAVYIAILFFLLKEVADEANISTEMIAPIKLKTQ